MPEEGLLIAIAQIAVTVAGFTAVTAVLAPPGGSWSPALRIRHRAIVSTSFNVVFEALVPVVAFAWLADVRTSLVVASGGVAVYCAWVIGMRTRQFVRTGAIQNGTGRVLLAPGYAATALFALNAILFVSVAAYSLALCLQLSVAVISFYSLVSAASS